MPDFPPADGDSFPGDLTSPGEQRHLHRLARLLLRNEHDADDVVQEAWLAALRAPTHHVRNWSAWLKSAVRRGAHHRRRRAEDQRDVERRASRDEAVFEESVRERIDSFRLLERAVQALDEPYRSVIRLRFFEELSHQGIAESLGRPLETVRSQVKRGLARLRGQLDDEHDGRRALWVEPLAAALAVERTRGGTGLLAASVASALALVAWALWAGFGSHGDGAWGSGGARAGGSVAEGFAGTDVGGPVESTPSGVRAPLGSVDPPEDGEGLVSEGPPGSGGSNLAAIELRILDPQGRRVPGAVVQAWSEGKTRIATSESDVDGVARFRVRGEVLGPIQSIERGLLFEAFHADHAWSMGYSIPMEVGTTRQHDLVLGGPPHRLTLTVLDEDGAPIPSASVQSQPAHLTANVDAHGAVIKYRRRYFATAEDGTVTLEHLEGGARQVTVDAAGFVATQDQVHLDARDTGHEVRLHRGATVEGSVRGVEGAAFGGVRVWVTRPLGNRALETNAGPDGTFKIDGVSPGPRYLNAMAHDGRGASLRIDLLAGEVFRWDPILEPLPELRVRVESDEGGPPPHGSFAALVAKVGGETWMDRQSLDVEGEVAFRLLPDEPVDLAVFTPRASRLRRVAAQRSGVREQEETLVIRLEPLEAPTPGCVFAQLETHGGEIAQGASIELHATETTLLVTGAFDDADGSLSLCDVPPGNYRVIVVWTRRGVVDLGERRLSEAGELELGKLTLPAPRSLEVANGPGFRGPGRLEARLDGIPVIVIESRGDPTDIQRLPGLYRWTSEDGEQLIEFEVEPYASERAR